jgi:hypothetical protein
MSQIFSNVLSIFDVNLRSMDFNALLNIFTRFFDYFKNLKPTEKVNFLLVSIVLFSWTLLYLNDKKHCENIIILTNRIDRGDSLRTQEQREYKKNLEFYTNKFLDASEIYLEQSKKIQEIKKTP